MLHRRLALVCIVGCFPVSCAGLHRLLWGSDVSIVFVGVFCDEPSGNKQMAHSQIVVVIAFS